MRALGIILAGGNNHKMRELTSRRAVAAMPIAGSYRAIDFTLSNMSNSHIQKVAVLTQYNARSLNEHLNSSKWWDFGRKQGGLYVFTPTITADIYITGDRCSWLLTRNITKTLSVLMVDFSCALKLAMPDHCYFRQSVRQARTISQ